jgi:flagellum-specific ATP synthase
VILLFDSITRFARAQREMGLATGEAPATRGFPPSVFSTLPKLLERSGTSATGSITGFYSILVEGDDMDEPVSDTVRGILDGHVVLSRRLAQRSHYPAVDVLDSVSRLAIRVAPPEIQSAAEYVRRLLAVYAEAEDLINVGAYVAGTNREIDEALEKLPAINAFLRQAISERTTIEDTRAQLLEIAGRATAQTEPGNTEEAERSPDFSQVSSLIGGSAPEIDADA